MKIKAIITGSTGMVGKGLLLECLESNDVESVLVINRQEVGISHPKLTEIIHKDFFNLDSIKGKMSGYNTCYFCMGTSAAGMNEEDYLPITHTLTLNFAKTFIEQNPASTFCYVSGAGTDSSEKGRIMWARVKGKTENDILAMSFKSAYMFRPGFIQPMKGIKSKTKIYNGLYKILSPIYPILKHLPKYVTSTTQLSKAMITVVRDGEKKSILESSDINKIN